MTDSHWPTRPAGIRRSSLRSRAPSSRRSRARPRGMPRRSKKESRARSPSCWTKRDTGRPQLSASHAAAEGQGAS
ncbi:MAG: hypothetical protein ACLS63_03505 [Flavonifractor plautii]